MRQIKRYAGGGPMGPFYSDVTDTGRLRRKTLLSGATTTDIVPDYVPGTIGASAVSRPIGSFGIDNNTSSANSGSSTASDILTAANNVAPFVSNIVNSFRRASRPIRGIPNNLVTLDKVNMDADRNRVSREINAAGTAADRSLDSNTAQIIRMNNLGTKLNEFSKISATENNANPQIGNQQTLINSQIQQGNNAKIDDYNGSLVEARIADQREQSANIANAGDKYVLMQNEQQKAKVSREQAQILATKYAQSGVYKRLGAQWKSQGLPDPLGMNYSWLEEPTIKRFGGTIKKLNY